MSFFNRKEPVQEEPAISNNEYITESKDRNRQVVLDYMNSVGIQILKYRGDTYFLEIVGNIHPNELMRLTNYRCKTRDGFCIVYFDNGKSFIAGHSLMEAYQAMEYLYNIMRTAQADSEF